MTDEELLNDIALEDASEEIAADIRARKPSKRAHEIARLEIRGALAGRVYIYTCKGDGEGKA